MSKIEVKTIELPNGETMGYRQSGSGGKVLLLIHGNMTSSKHWDLVMSEFPPGYMIYAVDQRGFGNSTYKRPIDSIGDMAGDIRLFADLLNLRDFTVAGWSLGGAVAMQFASDYPTYLEKLILIASVGIQGYVLFQKDEKGMPIPNRPLTTKQEIAADPVQIAPILHAYQSGDKRFLRLLWDTLIYTHHQPSPEKYEEYLDDMLTQKNYVDVYHALSRFNLSHQHNGVVPGTGAVDRIIAPTLVLHGDRDKIIPPATASETAKAIGNNADLLILKECGHSPPIDDLNGLISAMAGFIGHP
ncbi:MAG: alpha/beta hydrolase [Syntrophobacteraceae bacterium]